MRTLPALFAMLLLLLPSSLGAVMASQELCAQMEAMAEMSCCCAHDEAPKETQGPFVARTCCCDVKVPLESKSPWEPIRIAAEENSPTGSVAIETTLAFFLAPQPTNSFYWISPGPPRAPPRPLFLSFQSFLN